MDKTFYQFQEEERAEVFYNWYVTAILLNDSNLNGHDVDREYAAVYFQGTRQQINVFHSMAQAFEAGFAIGKRKGIKLEHERLTLCAQA